MSSPRALRRLVFTAVLALGMGFIAAPTSTAAESSFGPLEIKKGLERLQGGVNMTERSLTVAPQVGWDAGLENLRPIPAPWYRIWDMNVAWREVNPEPEVFDWSILERRIAQVESWGGRPLLVLGLTPQWAAADESAGDLRWGAGSASPPKSIDDWRNYVRAVASKFGNRIGAYEVWNEANLKTFWTGTPKEMAELTVAANAELKALGVDAKVLAPSVTTRLPSGARFTSDFINALEDPVAAFDAWTIHSYPAGNAGVNFDGGCSADDEAADPEAVRTVEGCIDGWTPRLAARQRAMNIRSWQQTLVETVGPDSLLLDKPIWDTEVNYGLPGPGIIPGVDWSQEQGMELIRYTLADSAFLGIDNIFWYQFTADPYSLLGVQMTPDSQTAATYSSFAPSGINSRLSSFELRQPRYGGCVYYDPDDFFPNSFAYRSLDCPGGDLRGVNLSGPRFLITVEGVNLEGANLSGADLTNLTVNNGKFSKARFFKATLDRVRTSKVDFSGANMSKVSAREAGLVGANLSDVNFFEANLSGAVLTRANLSGANLRKANLSGADLRNANLRGADLRNANLRGTKFAGANLIDAKF